jgi:CheY-like chemotaxis protein
MVVDDDPDVRAAICELLETEGYEALAAANGALALARLRGGGVRPGAILLDLMMPFMNGWEFRAEQLRDPQLRAIPIVLLTASGYSEAMVRDQFGRVAYLPKPPAPEALLRVVGRLVVPQPGVSNSFL